MTKSDFKIMLAFPQSEKTSNIVDVIQNVVCHKVFCVTLTFINIFNFSFFLSKIAYYIKTQLCNIFNLLKSN